MRSEAITSAQNEKFKLWQSLTTGRGLKKSPYCILSGKKLIEEFIKNKSELVVAELLPPKSSSLFLNLPTHENFMSFSLSSDLFKELDTLGTHSSLLILEQPVVKETSEVLIPEGLEVICPAGDPLNVGAIIRSAQAFGASKVILTQEAANPFHPKALKASAGSSLTQKLCYGPKLSDFFCSLVEPKSSSLTNLVALDMNGEDLAHFKWPKNIQILVGEEGLGIPKTAQVKRVKISVLEVESLNAAVAAGIAFYSYRLQHSLR